MGYGGLMSCNSPFTVFTYAKLSSKSALLESFSCRSSVPRHPTKFDQNSATLLQCILG